MNSEFFSQLDIDIEAFEFSDFIDILNECCEALVSDKLLKEIGGPRQ